MQGYKVVLGASLLTLMLVLLGTSVIFDGISTMTGVKKVQVCSTDVRVNLHDYIKNGFQTL